MPDARDKNLIAIKYLLGFIVLVVVVVILITLKDILIPITIAIFLTFLFHPLLILLQTRLKIPKYLALILVFIINFAIFYLMGLIFFSSFGGFSTRMEFYGQKLAQVVENILSPFNLTLLELEGLLGFQTQEFQPGLIIQKLFKAGIIQSFFSSFSNLLSDFFIVMFFWIFMIMGKQQFEEKLKIAFSSNSTDTDKYISSINEKLQSYLIIKTLVSLATGITFTIILMIYGIDFAVIWGLLAFILNYIPNIGSLLATLFPILIALLEYGVGFTSISLSVLLLVAQNVYGNVIEPKFMGEKMDLSPVFILISLIFWGWIWGIVGMFLAVPIGSLLKILCSNIDALKPIAVIISSKAEPLKETN
jgi:predicted PurR-regulated permease PerM